ncbi:MAG TPA: DUF1127 domain-containing protein [Roseiarcus sp.]|jgi:uncharacterized protein YjiS (DUF1127 family)|nr:DUF1127 domain-containing protein [Roseiarcus sp.]
MKPESRIWRTIGAGARQAAAWPFRVAAARATLKALASMDRRELADIGLNPSDVRDASAVPLDRDPTELLARRARERRRDAFSPPSPRAGSCRLDDPGDLPGRDRPPSRPGPKPAGQEARLVRTG